MRRRCIGLLAALALANPFHRDVGNREPEALPEGAAVMPGAKHPCDVTAVISLHQVLNHATPDALPALVLSDREHRDVTVADAVTQSTRESDYSLPIERNHRTAGAVDHCAKPLHVVDARGPPVFREKTLHRFV